MSTDGKRQAKKELLAKVEGERDKAMADLAQEHNKRAQKELELAQRDKKLAKQGLVLLQRDLDLIQRNQELAALRTEMCSLRARYQPWKDTVLDCLDKLGG